VQIFSSRSRSTIAYSIDTFGTEDEKRIWHDWSSKNPQIRKGPTDPTDDGSGPIAPDLMRAIILCLHRQYDNLRDQMRSPAVTEDEVADIDNCRSLLYSLARWLSPVNLDWTETI
jgi:hypothetical protein